MALSRGFNLTANSGNYTFTGENAVLSFGHQLTANSGVYLLAGGSAILTKTSVGPIAYSLSAVEGVYSINGDSAILTFTSSAPVLRPKGNGKASNLKKTQVLNDDEEVFELLSMILAEIS